MEVNLQCFKQTRCTQRRWRPSSSSGSKRPKLNILSKVCKTWKLATSSKERGKERPLRIKSSPPWTTSSRNQKQPSSSRTQRRTWLLPSQSLSRWIWLSCILWLNWTCLSDPKSGRECLSVLTTRTSPKFQSFKPTESETWSQMSFETYGTKSTSFPIKRAQLWRSTFLSQACIT